MSIQIESVLPKICFIGSGKLATQLSLAFNEKGFTITLVFITIEASVSEVSNKLVYTYTSSV